MGSGVKAKDEVFLRSDNYVDRLNVRVTVNLRLSYGCIIEYLSNEDSY